jgi:pimeloyl-ACP methyl ester carboxylesterase
MRAKRTVPSTVACFAAALLTMGSAPAFAADFPPPIPEGWSEGFVYANGIRIHYYHAVPAPGKPVILAVHGAMDTGLAWASVAIRLQKDYDIYMLDTRGHGLSDPATSADDRNTLLKDVMESAQKLHLEKPVLMGHSMGGGTVIRLGAEYPDFARGIIVVDAGISTPGPQRGGAPATRPSQPAAPQSAAPNPLSVGMRGTPDAMVAQNNYKYEDLVAKARRDNPRWSMMDCQYWAVAIKRFHGTYTDALPQATAGGTRGRTPGATRGEDPLSKIQAPVIILKADAPADVRDAQQKAASVMKNGKMVTIDGSAHNVQRDQPDRAAEVIREFMTTRVFVNAPQGGANPPQ